MEIDLQQFFSLLRSGLWSTPADATLFGGKTDWEAVLGHAKRQTVLGVVAEGIHTLPEDMRPSKQIMNHIRAKLFSVIQTHTLLNQVLEEVVITLQQQGFRPVLLKGQGVAMNYLDPTLRQCGDIDLYIGAEDYERARAFVCQHYATDDKSSESHKHYHFSHAGVVIELHRIAERLPIPTQNSRFQQWTERQLHGADLRKVRFGDAEVNLPPVDFDVLYIFNHAWHHFSAGGGIGLRQLCDWVRYLHTYHHAINLVELERNLKAFGLWNAWSIFGYIAVDILGLPPEEFPFYTSKYNLTACKILNMIAQEGNFGFYNSDRGNRPQRYLAGKLHSFIWMNRRFIRLFPMDPLQMSAIWMNYLYIGFREVLNHKLSQTR